jgi:gluconolactonase
MSALATRTAAAPPGPPELLPGRPDAIVDLQTPDGVELVGGTWRYADCRVEEIDFVEVGGLSDPDPLGPGVVPNRTYDVVPHAEAVDFDDSAWRVLAPEELQLRLANGRVCFNWYRITVTLPERVGDFEVAGSSVVFEIVVDDYAEVWVNGALPHALGDVGGPVAAGFNAPNRVLLTDDAVPGETFTIAVFGVNGPISASPRNYIWVRTATLDLYAPVEREPLEVVAAGFEPTGGLLWRDGGLLFSSGGAVYRWTEPGRITVFRPKTDAAAIGVTPEGLLAFTPRDGSSFRVNPHGDVSAIAETFDNSSAVAAGGRTYCCTADGVAVLSTMGERLDLIALPERPLGVALGDDGVLYIAAETSVYRRIPKGA